MSAALLVIDVQNDFTPGGALGVPDGDAVVTHVNDLIGSGRFDLVLATRDWHPEDHGSFHTADPPGPWPVHCVRGTFGAELHAGLDHAGIHRVVDKGHHRFTEGYSAFDDTGLAGALRDAGVHEVTIVGLATDYCVRATALDALREGFDVTVDAAGTRPVDVRPGDGERALAEIRAAGGAVTRRVTQVLAGSGDTHRMTAPPATDVERLAIDTVRTLSMDAVQAANSGHPGMPMAMAPLAYLLYREILHHDPSDPAWPDRDRFVLSAGHGSMWLYSALHLSGYDISLDDIKQFRQWGSITPGHPERDRVHVTPGVEVTTGPLGQGFANGVGLAMAERFLRERYGAEVQDHRTYVICSDGDLMEGISSEAASLAGKLGLGRMVYMYDDNAISLDGPTSLSFDSEDVTGRFEAYRWHVQSVEDVNDLDALRAAIKAAQDEEERPSLIRVKTVIGWPAPNKMGTSKAHGSPLGEDEVRLAKEALGWDPDAHFLVPDGVYEAFSAVEKGAALHAEWTERYLAWRAADEDRAAEWDAAWRGEPMPGFAESLPTTWDKDKIATRSAGQQVMAAFEKTIPTMVGGAADLSESTKTEFPDEDQFTRDHAGRNVFFGVREHGMAGTVNGLAAHGGIVRPYGSTFLQFSDYMRGSVRLGALTGLPTVWVWTHDSVALGEDGPTHQPVEHLAALRAIPGLVVLRPADAAETAEAWRTIVSDLEGPAALILSRQDLPVLDRDVLGAAAGVAKGAYVLRDDDDPEAVIVATGSEVWVALEAADLLDFAVRVVSMPSWELFEQQDEDYQDDVLPEDLPTVSVEAGISMGWERWADEHVSIERFGASAPGPEVLQRFGFTPSHVAQVVRDLLEDLDE